MKGDTRSLDYSSCDLCSKGPIRVILGLYGGYMGIMEKKMETAIMGYIDLFVLRVHVPNN